MSAAPYGVKVHRFSVPTTFVVDHVSRALDVDEDGTPFLWIVKQGKRVSTIEATAAGIAELRSDADYYARWEAEEYAGNDFLRSVVRSARSTVASIDRQMLQGKTR